MSFVVQQMLGNQALVTGDDLFGNSGKTIVSTTQWDELKARKNFDASLATFDAAVQAFYAPILAAAEQVQASVPEQDPAEYVVLTPPVEGTPANEGEIVQLSRDSMILRFIEEGNTDRLVWVDSSTLGVLAKS